MSSESATSASGAEPTDLPVRTGSDLPEPDSDVYMSDSPGREPEWKRRRRLDAVFGSGTGRSAAADCGEDHNPMTREWYDANRPPHHS